MNLISFLKKFFKSILKYVKAYLNLKSSYANELAQKYKGYLESKDKRFKYYNTFPKKDITKSKI